MTNQQTNIIIQHFNRLEEKINRIEQKIDNIVKSTNELASKAIFTGDAGNLLLELQNTVNSLKDEMEA